MKRRVDPDWKRSQVKTMKKMYEEGTSLREIARASDVSEVTVANWLKAEGVQIRKSNFGGGNKKTCDVELLKKLADEGRTIKEISTMMHVGDPTIKNWLLEYAIEINMDARKKRQQEDSKPKKPCKTCIFRSKSGDYGCDYIGKIKPMHSRGCSVIGCTRYIKGRMVKQITWERAEELRRQQEGA